MTTETLPDTRYYPSLDIAKFAAAAVIIAIHTEAFCHLGWLDRGFAVISRLAVPLFFAISSFLFFSRPGRRLAKPLKRLFILYVAYSILYAVLRVALGETLTWNEVWIFLFRGGFRHLWFLHGLMVALALAAALHAFVKKTWALVAIAVAVYSLGLMLGTYYPVFGRFEPIAFLHDALRIDEYGVRNGFFYGLPFVLLGSVLPRASQATSRIRLSVFLGISIACLCAETWIAVRHLGTQETILWLSCLPAIWFLMRLLVTVGACRLNTAPLRRMSTGIYLVHIAFVMVLPLAHGLVQFAAVFAASVIVAALLAFGCTRRHGGWIKYLT